MPRRNRSKRDIYYELHQDADLDSSKFFDKPVKTKSVQLFPRTENQKSYVTNLLNPEKHIVFAIGVAGTGKSMLATQAAIKGLIEEKYEKIVITRPNIAVDDADIGFLPGGIGMKMQPWVQPILDIFEEIYDSKEVARMIREKTICIEPIAFIRGRTFKNSFIIIDEAQGTTKNSLLSILTRIGKNSKMVITGDLNQSDRKNFNGLADFLERYQKHQTPIDNVAVNYFDKSDIQRHPVIQQILNLYD